MSGSPVPVAGRYKIMLTRAVGRGEIPPDTNQEVVLDLLFGAAYHRLLHGHQPLKDAFATDVVDMIIAAVQQRDARLPSVIVPGGDN
jgi:Tetracyclin repressor-like, C-terminal domain